MQRSSISRMPTAAVAGLSLVVAFAVADLTGVRPLGGLVLVAGGLWCVVRARSAGWWRLVLVVLVALALFIASHLLGRVLGAWPAVVLAGVLLAAATYGLVDRGSRGVVGDGAPTAGFALTEKLLTILGPPQIGDQAAPHRPVNADEQERERRLRSELERVVGPDGQVYLVERDGTDH
ncbi:MAG TPA: hypothetical protein VFW79_15070 [Cellulomonas sp.]|uniref:hypothetical protein n=1 Tax=Cellulomonas sp. TaxID=40001 RepID=UPI002E34A8B4|nr:hypothetical protein [Cellulomonas sp.]HEX5333961.1 hypothetical protein [Cellulomonas sp.]